MVDSGWIQELTRTPITPLGAVRGVRGVRVYRGWPMGCHVLWEQHWSSSIIYNTSGTSETCPSGIHGTGDISCMGTSGGRAEGSRSPSVCIYVCLYIRLYIYIELCLQ